MTKGRKMTSRIPVTDETHGVLKDLTHTGGVTFDELLRYFVELAGADMNDRHKNLQWGLEMRARLAEWKKAQEDKK